MEPDGSRNRLKVLRDGLLRLHMNLLTSQKSAYERDVERITSTGQYLNLALNDPWFVWLRELSQLIVTIDETLDLDLKEPGDPPDAKLFISRARDLLSPSETGDQFALRYYEAMQRDPGVVLAHGEMMKVFAGLGE